MENIIDIADLKQDDLNFNLGTFEGTKLMEHSLRKFKAGRSIVVDKDNNIIAGNKTAETADKVGIKKVRVIESDGTELIAVKRTDITLDSKEARELAMADNATAQVNLCWDPERLSVAKDKFGLDAFEIYPDFDLKEPTIESVGEVDTGTFDENQTLKIKLTNEQYHQVVDKLKEVNTDLPEALLEILGYYE